MGSLGVEVARKKAMWLHPKVIGANPSERWGHSACYSNGFVYIFGGCCGGMHFSDVLVLNLETMVWNILVTRGQGPGPRDSHSAVLVGHKMIVFGGTNGSEKVNDIHILDLQSKEWTHPECKGRPPSPRESHTATLVGDEKLVIFGGSGEGEGNYLNDLHVLDLKNMRWASPEVRGNIPVPRDSHSAVAIGNKFFLYGGDSGDRYQGDVDVLDLDTFTWSRLDVQGPSPGARAGHASVSIGTKVHVIGGVGDKQYYSDVWVLDIVTCSWTKLDICGLKPQGRFSHTAVITNLDIVIYGGCGEDEHPLNELLILQLVVELKNGLYNMPSHRITRTLSNQESKRFLREADNSKTVLLSINENLEAKDAQEQRTLSKQSFHSCTDTFHLKRRRTNYSKAYAIESEAEEHSLSLSQNSSPSQSDQEQTPCKKATESIRALQVFPLFKQQTLTPSSILSNHTPLNQLNHKNTVSTTCDLNVHGGHSNQSNSQNIHAVNIHRHDVHFVTEEQKSLEVGQFQSLVGAEVRGKVDGAFDSGYLMTAMVNGKTFRGVLFAPEPNLLPRGVNHCRRPSTLTNHPAANHINAHTNHSSLASLRNSQIPAKCHAPEFRPAQVRGSKSVTRSSTSLDTDPKHRSELKGVFLTLGGPGNGNGGS